MNGVLIPGGGQILEPGHPFYDTTAQLLDLAKKANDCGDFFPVSLVSGSRASKHRCDAGESIRECSM